MQESHHLYSDRYIVIHEVPDTEESGRVRLDRFLAERLKRRSRAQVRRAIEDGLVTVRRKNEAKHPLGRLKASFLLLPGDSVEVLSKKKAEPKVNFNYKVLFEDDDILVIEKPANLPVHPAGRFFFHTLIVHLRTNGFTAPLKAEDEYYLPHRIDRETSGIMVITKNVESCDQLRKQFNERATYKRYLAIAQGAIHEKEFEVKIPIMRSEDSRIKLKMYRDDEKGLSAHTHFKTLQVKCGYTLLDCVLMTGRQHQIRVHLAEIGHPIVGDKLYGLSDEEALKLFQPQQSARNPHIERVIPEEIKDKLILSRHALHAAELHFDHPRTGKRMKFETPLPKELERFMEKLPHSTSPKAIAERF